MGALNHGCVIEDGNDLNLLPCDDGLKPKFFLNIEFAQMKVIKDAEFGRFGFCICRNGMIHEILLLNENIGPSFECL